MLTGPKRFTDLLNNLPGMGTNLLVTRLRDLELAGAVERATLPPPAASAVYQLTPRGRALEHAVVELADWGLATLDAPPSDVTVRPAWSLLALQAAFRPEAAEGIEEEYQVEVADAVFHLAVRGGDATVEQGPAAAPALIVRADRYALLAVTSGQRPLAEALETNAICIDGDTRARERFLDAFGLETVA